MLGTVLCGGQSIRMGSDKGLLHPSLLSTEGYVNQANTWAQTAIDKLAELKVSVVISVNKDQYADYAAIFSPQQLITDNESLQIKGPVSGLLSVHIQYPSEDLLLLACDMPLMETDLLKELINNYNRDFNSDAFVYTNDGEPEPLCGIYKSSGLKHTLQLYQSNKLPKHSMKFMLEHINTHFIPLPDDKKKCFRNFNAHADLNGL